MMFALLSVNSNGAKVASVPNFNVSALANDIEVHKVKAPINKAFFIIIPPIIVLYKFIKGFY